MVTPSVTLAAKTRMEDEKLHVLYSHGLASNITIFVIAGLFAAMLQNNVDHRLLTVWLISMYSLAAFRLSLLYLYNNFPTINKTKVWLRYYFISTSIIGVAWSTLYLLAFNENNSFTIITVYMLCFGVIGAALAVLSVYVSLFAVYMLPQVIVLGIVSLDSLIISQSVYWILSILIFMIMMIAFAKTISRHIESSIQLQIQLRSEKEEYRLAKEAAEKANKSKNEFLANVSHEIRTPMNAVLGMTELLLKTDLNDNQQFLAESSYESADNLLSIINDILDFTKMDAGKMLLDNHSFNLNELLEHLKKVFTIQANNKDLSFELILKSRSPQSLEGDGKRLRQILVNLLGNAIKFTEKGEVKLSFDMENIDEHHLNLIFQITDTGIGISEDKFSDIFNPFIQADNSTTRIQGGTGLGLSICHQLTTLMGGELTLKSQVGNGSCFNLELPMLIDTRISEVVTDDIEVSFNKDCCVLIAEDNTLNQFIAKQMLEDLGCQVDIANDGEMALSLSDKNQYDLIFMDYHMPIMDGLEATRLIRIREQNTKQTPIIFMTADVQKELTEIYEDSGINDFINKPFTQNDLRDKLQLWI